MVKAPLRLGATLATLASVSAARNPRQLAVIDDQCQLTYQQLEDRVARLSSVLQLEHRVGKGSAVGIMCRNHAGFVESLLALSCVGADSVLMNTDFPGPQLKQVLTRQPLDCLIADQEFDAVLDSAGFDGQRIYADAADGTVAQSQLLTLKGLTNATAAGKFQADSGGRLTVLTSGTTGVPKGAPRKQSASNMLPPFLTFLTRLPLRIGMRLLIAPPLFHSLGLGFMWLSLALGATMIFRRRFDVRQMLSDIDNHRPDLVIAAPTVLQRLVRTVREDCHVMDTSSIDAFVSAGAPLSVSLYRQITDGFGDKLFNLYGASETGFGTIATPLDLKGSPGCVGRPTLGVRIRILGPTGQQVQRGQVGRICVKSRMRFEGYVGGGSRDDVEGYLDTGDLGHVDMSGCLFVDGRADDMIVSGGENVYPQEVAAVLLDHPHVLDAAVIGQPDPEFGQRLVAFVVCDQNLTCEEDLLNHAKQHLARFKIPKRVVFIPELPRNALGKVVRAQLTATDQESSHRR